MILFLSGSIVVDGSDPEDWFPELPALMLTYWDLYLPTGRFRQRHEIKRLRRILARV